MRLTLALLALSSLLGCGGGGATGGGGGGHGGAAASSGKSGSGGASATCADVVCSNPGEVCDTGICIADCGRSGAQPCAAGTVCDVSDQSPGKCVDPMAPCVTTSAPEPCGSKVCGPGAACDGMGRCYPRVPCADVVCDDQGCHGSQCACTRPAGCSPAPVGMPGQAGTLQDNTFRKGVVDLEFDPDCTAWGVTLISGTDYLRSVTPAGMVASFAGVTNLNMGEVSVLQRTVIPEYAPHPPANNADSVDVALSYICCAACGCQLNSTPQGVAHFDPATSMLPLVIPSKTFTTGKGPFGSAGFDTGPAGLSYGTDRVLYVGNVDTNGDYYRLDLATQKQDLVTTFPARVHASAPFDAVTMIVALEGGELRLLRVTDGTSTAWAMSDSPVTALVRDFFDGNVYVARRDGNVYRYSATGAGAPFQMLANPARISIAPDGYLYALEIPPPFADQTPTVERFALPTTR